MQIKQLEAMIEAILFTMGEAVELDNLAIATGQDEDTLRKVLHSMMDQYADAGRGIQIVELDGSFQMCSKPEMYEAIVQVVHVPKKHILTDVLLETLSIVAYRQPITKMGIEQIRGVKSDHSVNKLVEFGLIEEVGRENAPGRPILFATTEEFLRHFGIESLEELPILAPEQIEDFKAEAEEEVQMQLDI